MSNNTLLLQSLHSFYSQEHYRKELREVINGSTGVSLRSIDWFITNYSKKKNIYYQVYKDVNGIPTMDEKGHTFDSNINVHQSYKAQLKSYSKKTFDPFCRRDRILFVVGDMELETTIGQLNFFRWALKNCIISYIKTNKDTIETDMNTCLQIIKEKSTNKTGSRKQREQLSLSATRGLSKTNMGVYLTFD